MGGNKKQNSKSSIRTMWPLAGGGWLQQWSLVLVHIKITWEAFEATGAGQTV